MSYIHSIATALPDYELPQMEALDFMQHFFACDEVEKRRLTALYERSGIERRYSVVPDYNRKLNQQQLFKNTTQYEPFPDVEKRMEIYASESVKLALEAVNCEVGTRGCETIDVLGYSTFKHYPFNHYFVYGNECSRT